MPTDHASHAVASSVVLKDGQVVTREIKDNKKNTKNYLVFFLQVHGHLKHAIILFFFI